MQWCQRFVRSVFLAGVVLLAHGRAAQKNDYVLTPVASLTAHPHDGHGHSSGGNVGGAHGHEAAHHGHGGHHAPAEGATELAVMLLGTVGWVMSLFYFVNWPDKDVRQATWDTLSSMICIFCAVLIFASTKEVLVDFAGEKSGSHHEPPDAKSLILSGLRFVALLAFFQGLFWVNREKHWNLKYSVNLGGHVVGFAAIDLFGSFLQVPAISDSILHTTVAFGVMCVVVVSVFHPLHLCRTRFSAQASFIEECAEAETESIGLCLGLLVSMLIRFAITGHLPPVHGSPWEKSSGEVWALFGCAVLLTPCVVAACVAHGRLPETASGTARKFFESLQATASMSVGWCFLFWGYWAFYAATDDEDVGSGGLMTMRLLMALLFSAVSFVAILGIDALADRSGPEVETGLRALLKTSALVMGLSWEATFTEAVTSIGSGFEVPERTFVHLGITFGLCVVVLPAWAMYILPNTTHCLQVAKEISAEGVPANGKGDQC